MVSLLNWACDLPKRTFNFFSDHWKEVLFSTAVGVILEHLDVLKVLSKLSLIVVSGLASQGDNQSVPYTSGMPAVVMISNTDFVSRYNEKSPLDRCLLADDIKTILSKSPTQLAVDFDLSPLVKASDSEKKCQDSLDELLDREAGRLVLLVPFPTANVELLRIKHEWMLARCKNQLHFADGTLEQSMGMVTETASGDGPEIRVRLANQLHAGHFSSVCDSIKDEPSAQKNSWLAKKANTYEVQDETIPINFPRATRQLAVFQINSNEFERIDSLQGSPVFFGGDYGRDDSYMTSIGELPGVVIHGARLISLQTPIKDLPLFVAVLCDIGIALCFAWVVKVFWDGYVLSTRLDLQFEKHGSSTYRPYQATALSSLWIMTFALISISLVVFFFLAAEHLFISWSVVIAPLIIAVSILVDGFVSGPVEQIKRLLEDEHLNDKEGDKNHSSSVNLNAKLDGETSSMFLQLAGAIFIMLIFWLLVYFFPANLQVISGRFFIGALFALYGLLILDLIFSRRGAISSSASFASSLKQIFSLESMPETDPESGWRRLNKLGQLLARSRAVLFWATLGCASYIILTDSLNHF